MKQSGLYVGVARLSVILCAVFAACVHGPPAHEDSGRFVKVRTSNFAVHTDASAGDYQPLLERLETYRAAIGQALFPGTDTDTLDIIYLRDADYFESLAGPQVGGLFLASDQRPVVVTAVMDYAFAWGLEGMQSSGLDIAIHELGHRFIHAAYPRAPAWLHEGLATFVETAGLRDGQLVFGLPRPDHLETLARGQVVALEELLTSDSDNFHGDWGRAHYATAWLFIHYLAVAKGKLGRVLKGVRSPPEGGRPWVDLVEQVFPETGLPRLDAELKVHAESQVVAKRKMPRIISFAFAPPATVAVRDDSPEPEFVKQVCLALKKRGPLAR